MRATVGLVVILLLAGCGDPQRSARIGGDADGVPVMVLRDGAQWVAVVGIRLSAAPGGASLVLQKDDTETTLPSRTTQLVTAIMAIAAAPRTVHAAVRIQLVRTSRRWATGSKPVDNRMWSGA